ncbi:MAG: hypothetical protein JWP44_1725 [Mucilaginibacter sp.]|nr:hypothetical protein [Mucilaginibacter sp.]
MPGINLKTDLRNLLLATGISLTLIINPARLLSQPTKQGLLMKQGSLGYLKQSNGFKDIVLGSNINIIPSYKLGYMDGDYHVDADSCLKLNYKDTDLKFGDNLFLDLVGIRTFKNKVVNIYLFFKKADGYKVLQSMLDSYGLFTDRPDNYQDVYNWNTSRVSLSLMYEMNVDLGVAIFTCNDLQKEIETRKQKLALMTQLLSSQF